MAKLIATDLDGTLFYPKHRIRMISKEALAFIRKRIDMGDRFAIVSGRNNGYGLKVAKKIDRPIGIIGCNGAIIMDEQKNTIRDMTIDGKLARHIVEWARANLNIKGFFVMTDDNKFYLEKLFKSPIYNIGYFFWDLYQGVYRTPMKVSKKRFDNAIDNSHSVKIMLMFGIGEKHKQRSFEANKLIEEKFGDKLVSSWSYEFIELSPLGASKSNGLKFYSDYHKIKHDDVYVVGDSGNDISMFQEFPEHSFCMENASLSVSKYAKHTVRRFEDIEKYLEERK